jgi:trehalose/maltose hydrolase-like predicted phosphorylase
MCIRDRYYEGQLIRSCSNETKEDVLLCSEARTKFVNGENTLKVNFIYKGKVVLVFQDKGLDNYEQNLTLKLN